MVAKAGVAFSCAVGVGMRPRVLVRPRWVVDPVQLSSLGKSVLHVPVLGAEGCKRAEVAAS